MNIIVPMAGMGKRMRPHTLTTPKPLIPVAGKPIVEHLVEDIAKMLSEKINTIGFVIGRFGPEVEKQLLDIAARVGAKGKIYYQDEALGTAHAVRCAEECLEGPIVIAFADTIFKADFQPDPDADGVIWVSKVENPQQFGVVKYNDDLTITDFVEKPQTFVSDLAIIGIYYAKDGARVKSEIDYLINNGIKDKGEYQLTNALENMKNQGLVFKAGKVDEWLDCGNKNATVFTNSRVLTIKPESASKGSNIKLENSIIIEPCFIGDDVAIQNSVIGPHVSIGKGSRISDSRVSGSIILEKAEISNLVLQNSLIGNSATVAGTPGDLSAGDYTVLAL